MPGDTLCLDPFDLGGGDGGGGGESGTRWHDSACSVKPVPTTSKPNAVRVDRGLMTSAVSSADGERDCSCKLACASSFTSSGRSSIRSRRITIRAWSLSPSVNECATDISPPSAHLGSAATFISGGGGRNGSGGGGLGWGGFGLGGGGGAGGWGDHGAWHSILGGFRGAGSAWK
eukprot:5873791-Prymnesium_polylepis.1